MRRVQGRIWGGSRGGFAEDMARMWGGFRGASREKIQPVSVPWLILQEDPGEERGGSEQVVGRTHGSSLRN